MTAGLPPSLAPWSAGLSELDPQLAVAIGPMIRRIDELIGRHGTVSGAHGEIDGYGGLTSRGQPAQLLMSEWALADAEPSEFLRRAAVGELLYLAPNFQDERRRGRVAVLFDAGPDQLGAPRLVQLAVLIVLHRRADRRGDGLMIGVLGQPPGTWNARDVRAQLHSWLHARTAETADADNYASWKTTVEDADEVWLITGRRLAAALPSSGRTIVTAECAWAERGVAAVEVLFEGDRLELVLPHTPAAIRALRGAAFREQPAPSSVKGFRFPAFPSGTPWLLARGHTASDLVAVRVPSDNKQPVRPRRYHFAGPVVTAAFVGRRLLALVLEGDELRVVINGKQLRSVAEVSVRAYELGVDRADLEAAAEGPLRGLMFDGEALIVDLADRWWRLRAEELPVEDTTIRAVAPSGRADVPHIVREHSSRLWLDGTHLKDAAPDRGVLANAGAAWESEPQRWCLGSTRRDVWIAPDETVVGVCVLAGEPSLITLSGAGLIVRLHQQDAARTLTQWSGGVRPPIVHPTHPWLIVERVAGRIEVVDLERDAVILTAMADP